MTHFINFSDLTWPEVAALPRELPLVLPLGEGYPPNEIARRLGSPERAGMLQAIPFGWQGSSLPVKSGLLEAMLKNLLGGLVEDGFTKVVVLAPAGCSLRLDVPCLELPLELPPARLELDASRVVLAPVGHIEQHGYHLPLSTDTIIIEAIGQAAAAALPRQAVCLPVIPYGVSTHRTSFAGTFNCGGRAFEDFWLGVINELALRQVQMVYLLSGHGGNCSFLTTVVKYAGEQHPDMFCATAWLYLSGPEGIRALEKYRRSGKGGIGHACELETALLLHLRPDLVHMERVVDETDFISTPAYYMEWMEGGALIANPPWLDDTLTGAYGAGSLAIPENGKLWLQAAAAEKVAHVKEIIEQHDRRTARRKERGAG